MNLFHVAFMPANQCWCIMFGDAPLTVDADVANDSHHRTLFSTKREAEQVLASILSNTHHS